ncbi:MAG: intermembrane transport protein PqiB [Pseudomonadota bacterium]
MNDTVATVKAGVSKNVRIHKIWLVPVAAFVIGLWMVYAHWASQGPMIEVTFSTAEGIEAGQTKVKRKNVEIGEVLGLRLTDDAQSVALSIRVHKEYADLLREDAKFWVVRPRIGPGGVSGLSTLLSGGYVEMSRGIAEESAREFVGLEAPPVTPIGTPGLHVTLSSDGSRPLVEGQPVLFHGTRVGRVEYVHFNTTERRTYYNVFITAPHDNLITTNTRFWFNNGVSFDLSAEGFRVEMASLETIIEGGVSFDVPPGQPLGERVTERAFFTIYPNRNAISETQYEHSLQYVLLFEESVRGLRPGAPVEYRGVRVGEVLRTDIDYPHVDDLLAPNSRIPVLVEITPALLGYEDTPGDLRIAENRIGDLLENGLHGSLGTGNLLTGRKLVELEYVEGSGAERQLFGDYTVIPSVSGRLGRLFESVASTLDALGEMPLDDMVTNASTALEQMTATLAELDEILDDESSREVFSRLNATLSSFQKLADDFSAGSATYEELQRSLQSLEITLKDLQPVLRQLRTKPNSLVFGADGNDDPEPKGANE